MNATRNTPALIADLGAIIDELEARGRLVRVQSPVNLKHDLAGIAARFEARGGRCCLKMCGGTRRRSSWGFIGRGRCWRIFFPARKARCRNMSPTGFPPGRKSRCRGDCRPCPVLEVVEPKVDVKSLPIPVHATGDAGPLF